MDSEFCSEDHRRIMAARSARYARNSTDFYAWEEPWSPIHEECAAARKRRPERSLDGLDAALIFVLLSLVGVLALGNQIPPLHRSSPFMKVAEWTATPQTMALWPARTLRGGGALRLWPESKDLRNYTLAFDAAAGTAPVSWVLRAAGADSYYRMTLVRTGGTLRLERAVVINGRQESSHIDLPSSIPARAAVKVTVSAEDDRFVTSINGAPIDAWQDSRLTAGSAGWITGPGLAAVTSAHLTITTRRAEG